MMTEEEFRRTAPKRPGNYGGETFREYCGLKDRRTYGKRHRTGRPVTTQDLYRAIVAHGGPS